MGRYLKMLIEFPATWMMPTSHKLTDEGRRIFAEETGSKTYRGEINVGTFIGSDLRPALTHMQQGHSNLRCRFEGE